MNKVCWLVHHDDRFRHLLMVESGRPLIAGVDPMVSTGHYLAATSAIYQQSHQGVIYLEVIRNVWIQMYSIAIHRLACCPREEESRVLPPRR